MPCCFSHPAIYRHNMSEPTAQQQQPQNGKERSRSTEEKEVPREPALVCKDINVRSVSYMGSMCIKDVFCRLRLNWSAW